MLDLGTLSARMTLDSSQYMSSLSSASSSTISSMAEIRGIMIQTLGVAGITGLFIKAGKSAMDFSAELANVASIVNDLDISKIKNGLLELNSVYGSSIELTKAFYQTYSAGIRGTEEDLVRFTGQVASLSKTILSDQATTVQAVTKLMNAYGISVKDAGQVFDTFFQIIKLGQTTGPELAGSIGQVVNSAAVAKLSLDELGASIATLTRTMPTAVAITSLNQAILAFIQPTKEAMEVAKRYGIELSATALQQKGFANAIKEVNEKAGDNVEALALMFGNVRSFRAVAALASNQAEEFQNILSQFRAKGGTQLEAFGRATANLRKTWSVAMVEMEKAFIQLGDALAPTIKEIAGAIGAVAQTIQSFSESEIQTGLLAGAFVLLTGKVAAYTSAKAAATAAIVQNTIATQANTAAQSANNEMLGVSSVYISKARFGQLAKQMDAFNSAAGMNAFSVIVGGLNQLLLAGTVAITFYKLTESFMENTEAGNRLRDTLGGLIYDFGNYIGAFENFSRLDADISEKTKDLDLNLAERWKAELEKSGLKESADALYAQFVDAIKSGNEKAKREVRNRMSELIRSIRESAREEVEQLPPYQIEINDLINIGGAKGAVAQKLKEMTEAEWNEFKIIAQEIFKTDDLFKISPTDYAKILNIQAFRKVYENEEEEFKKMAKDFSLEIQRITTQAIVEGQSEDVLSMRQVDVLKRQREILIRELKDLEKDRLEAVKNASEEEVKATEKAISKRLQLYEQINSQIKSLEPEELTSEDIILRQVREAGGLAAIRKKILAQEEGTPIGLEKTTIEQYLKTLNLEQRKQYEGLVAQYRGKGADIQTAESNAIIVMQRNLEKQAKIDEANSRQMVDLLQQLNDYFKGGGTLVLTAP